MDTKDVPNAVLLLPGLGGSILYAKIKDKNGRETEEFVWPKLANGNQIMSRYMKGKIDPNSLEIIPFEDNVKIFATDKDFGLHAIDYLVPDIPLPHDVRAYFHDLIEMFQMNGYKPGISLWGYPYDWRQDFSLPCIMNPLRARIYQAFRSCGMKKINIISHSQGGLVMRTFISLFPDDVSKYVRRWITIGTPFQGASRITVALLFGYNFNLPTFLVSPRLMQAMQRTIPLTFWFLPPKNCPFSPKVAIQYSGQREITWYGFHNDQDNKCWDYDSIRTIQRKNNKQQNKRSDNKIKENEEVIDIEQDEEYQLLSGIIDGKIQMQQFVIDHTHFSRRALNKYENLNHYISEQDNKDDNKQKDGFEQLMINKEQTRKRSIFAHLKRMNKVKYEQCQCGMGFGCIQNPPPEQQQVFSIQQSASQQYQYTQRFLPSFIENRTRINMLLITSQSPDFKILPPPKQITNNTQIQPQQQIQQQQQVSPLKLTPQQYLTFSSSFLSQFNTNLPPSTSFPFKYFEQQTDLIKVQQQEIQITPMEYINMPMFAPCPLHSLFRPGFALAGYKQDRHIELRKKKNQRSKIGNDDDEEEEDNKNKQIDKAKSIQDGQDNKIEQQKEQNKLFQVPQQPQTSPYSSISSKSSSPPPRLSQQQQQQIYDQKQINYSTSGVKSDYFHHHQYRKVDLISYQDEDERVIQNIVNQEIKIEQQQIDQQQQQNMKSQSELLLQQNEQVDPKEFTIDVKDRIKMALGSAYGEIVKYEEETQKQNNKNASINQQERDLIQFDNNQQSQRNLKKSYSTSGGMKNEVIEIGIDRINNNTQNSTDQSQLIQKDTDNSSQQQGLIVDQGQQQSFTGKRRSLLRSLFGIAKETASDIIENQMIQSSIANSKTNQSSQLQEQQQQQQNEYTQIIQRDAIKEKGDKKQKKEQEKQNFINPLSFPSVFSILRTGEPAEQIQAFVRARIQGHIDNSLFHPPHNNQLSFFELIREIQHYQNEMERVKLIQSDLIEQQKQFMSLKKKGDNKIQSQSSPQSQSVQISPYISPSQGGKPTLWEDPPLDKLQAHVEEIRTLPVNFPPEGEFEFINIYGSGVATTWHLFMIDNEEGNDKAFHIYSNKELAEYGDYASGAELKKPNEKIKQQIKVEQQKSEKKEDGLKDEEIQEQQSIISQSSQSDQTQPLSSSSSPSSQSYSDVQPLWTIVDGDGTVPCCSSSNDGLRADARFEIRGQSHMDLMFDSRVLNLIAAIFGLWKQDDQQIDNTLKQEVKEGLNQFKPYKCQYTPEYERVATEAKKIASKQLKKLQSPSSSPSPIQFIQDFITGKEQSKQKKEDEQEYEQDWVDVDKSEGEDDQGSSFAEISVQEELSFYNQQ